ncbi:phosphotransferase [Actinoplanes sp. CA-131856]
MSIGHRPPSSRWPSGFFGFDGWQRMLELGPADDWERAHLEPAAAMLTGWQQWTAGEALVHRDIRVDNTARAREAVLLDWAYASAGAPWIDLAQLAADVVASGHEAGPRVAADRAYRLLQTLPPLASRFVVGLAGLWRFRSATVPDVVLPIAAWRRARALALRPLVSRLLAERSATGHRTGCRD